MTSATNLKQLLRIRQEHLAWLRRLPGYLGSAVGHKYIERKGKFAVASHARVPAIIVFVRKKSRSLDVVPDAEKIPATFTSSDGFEARTDVVQGALLSAPPPTLKSARDNRALLQQLHEANLGLVGGLPIASSESTGTAACVVTLKGRRGFLTNRHVAGLAGTQLLRPPPLVQEIGTTRAPVLYASSGGPSVFKGQKHRIDAAFVEFPRAVAGADVHSGVHGLPPLASNLAVDLNTMGLVGTDVISVGQVLGLRRGTIAAFGYEWEPQPDSDKWETTDYLILGEDGGPFAAEGDSGKLVVTADGAHPVALLWGGQRQQFWTARAQESWAYASAIDVVLHALGGAKILAPAARVQRAARKK